MNTRTWSVTLMAGLLVTLLVIGCDEGTDDWNSSAKISGYVYADAAHTRGLPGVQVVIEADPNSSEPYIGPDRWFTTDEDGYFEGFVHLGYSRIDTTYNYIGDVDIAYYIGGWTYRWGGGITVSPGSHFTLPPVDTTMQSSGGQ